MIEDRPSPELADRLSRLRCDLEGVESVLPAVQERLARATVLPRPSRLPWALAAAAAAAVLVFAVGAAWLWLTKPDSGQPPTARIDPPVQPHLPAVTRIRLGDVKFVEHLSLAVDQRAVLVVWSSRGNSRQGVTPAPPGANGQSKYRQRVLRQTRTADGQTVTWSLFLAEPGVLPVLDPPSVRVSLANDSTIRFSTSPRAASREELHLAIRSITVACEGGPGVEDIERAIREESDLRG